MSTTTGLPDQTWKVHCVVRMMLRQGDERGERFSRVCVHVCACVWWSPASLPRLLTLTTRHAPLCFCSWVTQKKPTHSFVIRHQVRLHQTSTKKKNS